MAVLSQATDLTGASSGQQELKEGQFVIRGGLSSAVLTQHAEKRKKTTLFSYSKKQQKPYCVCGRLGRILRDPFGDVDPSTDGIDGEVIQRVASICQAVQNPVLWLLDGQDRGQS